MRMALDLGAQLAPVEFEIFHRHRALRITHPYQSHVARPARQRQRESPGRELRTSPVHLEQEVMAGGGWLDEYPAVRARAGVAIANGSGSGRQIRRRSVTDLRQQEVVVGSMRL